MAAQILPDLPAPGFPRLSGRAGFIAITLGLHVAAGLALWQLKTRVDVSKEPAPIEAALLETPALRDDSPPAYPPPVDVTFAVLAPDEAPIETDAITASAEPVAPAVSTVGGSSVSAPLVASVEYIRTQPPVYPKESRRRNEHGTVVLRVLVDASGRPAQIQVERSSGFDRLDDAARCAVEKFLFRPYEVNGIAQPAQVLIPIGFDRRAS